MAYRRLVLARWTRRDRLAVLTIAVTVAFFTSSVVAVTAVSTQTTQIAADYGSTASVEYVPGPATNGSDEAVTVPATVVTVDGTDATLVGVSNRTIERLRAAGIVLPVPPDTGATVEATPSSGLVTVTSSGTTQNLTVESRPASHASIPGNWYLSNESVAADAGTGGRFEVRQTGTVPADGTPLRGALAFFVAGTQSLVTLLLAVAVGAGVLVGVVVYSVVRMTVRDRRDEIRLVRAVGAHRHQVVGLFGGRALLLTGVAIALGYAVGVIGVNVAVNVGVFVGLPTSLSMQVTGRAASRLLRGFAVVLACGGVAGVLATLPAVRGAPYADVDDSPSGTLLPGRLGRLADPELLDWRGVVPTAAAVAVFVAVLLLVSSFAGALGPLAGGDGATVTQPGAVHPIASSVPAHYGGLLESQSGVTASPEILGFTTLDGAAVLYRGADYDRFADVSDATLVDGRRPAARQEALVGSDLADALDVHPGDEVTIGGSTRPAFTRVEVVGTYDAPGYFDDHLLVSLATARHLSNKRGDAVNFVRLSDRPAGSTATDGLQVVSLSAPDRTTVGSSVRVTATVLNPTAESANRTVRFVVGDETRTRTVSVRSFGSRRVSTTVTANATGPLRVRAGDETATLDVLPTDAVELAWLPGVAPPDSDLRTRVVDVATGAPVANATVTLGGQTVRTGGDGGVTVPVPSTGSHEVRVAHGDYETTDSLQVEEGSRRRLVASWDVPQSPTPITPIEARVTLSNPWNETLTRTVVLDVPGDERVVETTLAPGESRAIAVPVGRLAPDSYAFAATSDGDRLAHATTTVQGDERLASAIASHTGTGAGTTGLGRAVATVFGNVQVVVAALVAFAGVMTVGGTTAAFARSVQARYRELGLYRAVGASRGQVLRIVVRDGVHVGIVATLLGVALGLGATMVVDRLGLLRVYGVSAPVSLDPGTLAVAVASSLALVVLGTVLAVWPALRQEPIGLIAAGGE
ncbi:FtsX-like permease family protein [Haloarchaeobius sp. HRN-SO-5]|uniref:ABC transporter permease n=1 Tax=Haloarchaeobius sp. HRN-SO-5 TaxID=3446118 RepID=UPI003EC0C6DB